MEPLGALAGSSARPDRLCLVLRVGLIGGLIAPVQRHGHTDLHRPLHPRRSALLAIFITERGKLMQSHEAQRH
jgi:hypothetical protein